jgi:hypothetical protein
VHKKYPQTQNLHHPQCADKENTNIVQRGVKNITNTSWRRHGAGGSLSRMALSKSKVSSLSWRASLCMSAIWNRMSSRVSCRAITSEALNVIVSSYSTFSSGLLLLLSCSLLLSCHLRDVHGLWLKLWCGFGHVETNLVPLDVAEIWALSDRPVYSIALDPFQSQNVSDEKRERQTPCVCVLSRPMVHSFPEFLNLSPYDLRNGALEPLWNA